ncbi:Gfo/Idh/MocA family protein [Aquisphaera insulae]|uniref:Gfo/Idh/MocA family protein n=1 Tax=Aquisphaera insulae TaxID=2712864 RepID=UPI0013EC0858|nr:Gfo/Idh/MocA family oxidoreductase [Aquisphaera insulae]
MRAISANAQRGSRRDFLRLAAVAGFPAIVPASALGRGGRVAPSNRVTVGVIGTGNQGMNDIQSFLKDDRVQIVAVCDVNRESPGYWDGKVGGREPAKRLVEKHYAANRPSGDYRGCDAYVDFREVLGRKDIDAVEIATPDHWHAIPVLEACLARKDIYCQKPLALTIAEGRAMSYAVNKHRVVFQTGSQQRSDPHFRQACELVRNGRIGDLKVVRVGLPGGRPDFGKTGDRKQVEPVPAGFEYDRWLGPAPQAPYAPARCHVNFRWIYDYSGGQVTDWGGHHPDCAQWGMGTELTGPIEIRNAHAEFAADPLWNTATEFSFEAVYENGVRMIVSNRNTMGVTFEGTKGKVYANRGKHTAEPESILASKIGPDEIHLYRSDDHFRNFIDCVISRGPTAAPVEVAHRSITICHLGNIAMRLGRKSLKWDPRTEQIIGDDEASRMLSRPYREGWTLPTV